jgi:hypothetical protein
VTGLRISLEGRTAFVAHDARALFEILPEAGLGREHLSACPASPQAALAVAREGAAMTIPTAVRRLTPTLAAAVALSALLAPVAHAAPPPPRSADPPPARVATPSELRLLAPARVAVRTDVPVAPAGAGR